MKPIEPGCKARIVKSHAGHEGLIVTVLDIAGDFGLDGCDRDGQYGKRWNIDVTLTTNRGFAVSHIGEGQLKRIDDYDGNKKISWEDMEDIWSPKELKVRG